MAALRELPLDLASLRETAASIDFALLYVGASLHGYTIAAAY
jgi:hypothetical protein